MEKRDYWGVEGDRLKDAVVKSVAQAELKAFEGMLASLKAGQSVTLNPQVDEVEAIIGVWKKVVADPIGFDRVKVRKVLAALPNSVGGRILLVDLDMAVHFNVMYTYRDYSKVLPKNLASKNPTILPVKVFRLSEKDSWNDVVVATINKIDFSGVDRKRGCYTKCVGIAAVVGGSVTPCVYEDEVRITDIPRFRCSSCTKALKKMRDKVRRTGRQINSPRADLALDKLLVDLSK